MEVPGPPVSGKPGETSVKWQLCYDMTAKMWWMVSAQGPATAEWLRRVWGPLYMLTSGETKADRVMGLLSRLLPGKVAEATRPHPGTRQTPNLSWARSGALGIPRAPS